MRRTHGEPGSAAATRVVSRFRDSPFSVFLVLCLSSRFVSLPFRCGSHEETRVNVARQPAAFLRPARCDAAANVLRRARVCVHGYSPRRTDSFASRPSRITEFREISNATCCLFARRFSATRYTPLSASRRIKNNAPQALNVPRKTYELREKSSGRFARPSTMPMGRSASQRNVHAARKAVSGGERFVRRWQSEEKRLRTSISKRRRWSSIPPGKGSNRNSKSKYSRCPLCTVRTTKSDLLAQKRRTNKDAADLSPRRLLERFRCCCRADRRRDERTNSKDVEEKGTTKTFTEKRNNFASEDLSAKRARF